MGLFSAKPSIQRAENVLDPPAYDTFLSPFWRLSVISLQRKEAPTRPIPISEASKLGFGEHALQYVFHPPQIRLTRFASPSAAALSIVPDKSLKN